MEAKTERARASSSVAAKTNLANRSVPSEATSEIDYSPKKMTPRETLMLSLKLAGATAVVFALLWLAHVKLDR